jgi:hypothetical protein
VTIRSASARRKSRELFQQYRQDFALRGVGPMISDKIRAEATYPPLFAVASPLPE